MADEATTTQDSGGKDSPRLFTGKGLIVFIVTFAIYTIILGYLFMGDRGKTDSDESAGTNQEEVETIKRLTAEQNMIPPFKLLEDVVVPIRMDKNGDTSKTLYASFSFHLGFTAAEQQVVDELQWPPKVKEITKFKEFIAPEKYTNNWSLLMEVLGAGGLAAKLGEEKESYLYILHNAESEIREKVNDVLMSMTYSQINTDDGKRDVVERLKLDVNDILFQLGKHKRIRKVSWTKFFFGQ